MSASSASIRKVIDVWSLIPRWVWKKKEVGFAQNTDDALGKDHVGPGVDRDGGFCARRSSVEDKGERKAGARGKAKGTDN